jgi:hypothetical protein
MASLALAHARNGHSRRWTDVHINSRSILAHGKHTPAALHHKRLISVVLFHRFRTLDNHCSVQSIQTRAKQALVAGQSYMQLDPKQKHRQLDLLSAQCRSPVVTRNDRSALLPGPRCPLPLHRLVTSSLTAPLPVRALARCLLFFFPLFSPGSSPLHFPKLSP